MPSCPVFLRNRWSLLCKKRTGFNSWSIYAETMYFQIHNLLLRMEAYQRRHFTNDNICATDGGLITYLCLMDYSKAFDALLLVYEENTGLVRQLFHWPSTVCEIRFRVVSRSGRAQPVAFHKVVLLDRCSTAFTSQVFLKVLLHEWLMQCYVLQDE